MIVSQRPPHRVDGQTGDTENHRYPAAPAKQEFHVLDICNLREKRAE
jgi:hypothetical protein